MVVDVVEVVEVVEMVEVVDVVVDVEVVAVVVDEVVADAIARVLDVATILEPEEAVVPAPESDAQAINSWVVTTTATQNDRCNVIFAKANRGGDRAT